MRWRAARAATGTSTDRTKVNDPGTFWSGFWLGIRYTLAIAWAIPWFVIAIACCVPIVTIPVGLAALGIACFPFGWVSKRRVEHKVAWKERDHALEEDEEVPWSL